MSGASTGSARLAESLRRLARLGGPRLGPEVDDPGPGSAWQAAMERRLAKVEKALSSQNRLLLLAILGAAADVLLRVLER